LGKWGQRVTKHLGRRKMTPFWERKSNRKCKGGGGGKSRFLGSVVKKNGGTRD